MKWCVAVGVWVLLPGCYLAHWDDPEPEPPVMAPLELVQIARSTAHTCVLRNDGAVLCWGANQFGQVGGHDRVVVEARHVEGLPPATHIAVGTGHTCAVVDGGGVYCWGLNEEAQLGMGDEGSPDACAYRIGDQHGLDPASCSRLPVLVRGVSGARLVAVGNHFSCVLTDGAQVWCWGWMPLQHAQDKDEVFASPVHMEAVQGITSIAASHSAFGHACATTELGEVLCWGGNGWGQSGQASAVSLDVDAPRTANPVVLPDAAVGVSLGFDHSCAVLANGSVHCWGANYEGQLGSPATSISRSEAATPVEGIGDIVQLASHRNSTCGRLSTGAVHCWQGDARDAVWFDDGIDVSGNCAILSDETVGCWDPQQPADMLDPVEELGFDRGGPTGGDLAPSR